MRFLIITGRSGSGKSSALHLLEDEGYTCIDNIPVSLLPELIAHVGKSRQKTAIGIDARNIDSDLGQLKSVLETSLLPQDDYKVIYLDTRKDILLKRFSETRRKHPLSNKETGLEDAIDKEQRILSPMADLADRIIDTSNFNLHELRSTIKNLVLDSSSPGMAITFTSFGYKYGVPIDADFVFDVRSLPNPHWEPNLRAKTGLENEVIQFLDAQAEVQDMLNDIASFISKWIPSFKNNNRSYLTVAVGCTGGMHRSVYLCEKLADRVKNEYGNVQARHRQINK
ncbi:RNase adapter protein RapZ [Thalassocella blandensis]|nr:RNase adapter protein RapZ [Thalassocella blandensis]